MTPRTSSVTRHNAWIRHIQPSWDAEFNVLRRVGARTGGYDARGRGNRKHTADVMTSVRDWPFKYRPPAPRNVLDDHLRAASSKKVDISTRAKGVSRRNRLPPRSTKERQNPSVSAEPIALEASISLVSPLSSPSP